MPSFLSKVFGRKRQDDKEPFLQGRVSDGSLEGNFEVVSPSATNFPEVANGHGHGKGKEKEKAGGFTLFRTKSRPASPDTLQQRVDLPHLSLDLPDSKEDSRSRALCVVFEADPDAQILLTDSIIENCRLNPLETLTLVRACSQAITVRGLETLGIMYPHWYSASTDIQRRLISLFIQSLAPKGLKTTLSSNSASFASIFESEINYTRSPHDVAAVLRWGLRHLQLENNFFGKDERWYKTFLEAERSSQYSPNSFSKHLAPQLPASHLELLVTTLEILSSLASHAETNGVSGSKLSKFFGLWLLTAQRAEEKDDWATFYARWERMGRILEHLFLSRIRDEATCHRMPTRLLELIYHYPYNGSDSVSTNSDLLSRPRFSTRRYDALFVRVETELSPSSDEPKHHPLRLITEAFNADFAPDSGPHTRLWNIIKQAGQDKSNPFPAPYLGLSRILADETIRLLSLVPADSEPLPSTFDPIISFQPAGTSRQRSFSLSKTDKAAVMIAPYSPTKHIIGTDWAQFSASGFLEQDTVATQLAATLVKTDAEVTIQPRTSKRPKADVSPLVNGRKSLDNPWTITTTSLEHTNKETKIASRSTVVSLIQLDEAFIDFWSDALLDPIASNWPAFVVCKLKPTTTGLEVEGKRLNWLVIEQSFKKVPPPLNVPDNHASSESVRRQRPSSPKPSFRSDLTASARKRFSFFSSSTRGTPSSPTDKPTKSRKKHGQSPSVTEMGEVLAEEDEKVETVKLRVPSPKHKKSHDVSQKSIEVARTLKEGKDDALGLSVVNTPAIAARTTVTIDLDSSKAVSPPNGSTDIITWTENSNVQSAAIEPTIIIQSVPMNTLEAIQPPGGVSLETSAIEQGQTQTSTGFSPAKPHFIVATDTQYTAISVDRSSLVNIEELPVDIPVVESALASLAHGNSNLQGRFGTTVTTTAEGSSVITVGSVATPPTPTISVPEVPICVEAAEPKSDVLTDGTEDLCVSGPTEIGPVVASGDSNVSEPAEPSVETTAPATPYLDISNITETSSDDQQPARFPSGQDATEVVMPVVEITADISGESIIEDGQTPTTATLVEAISHSVPVINAVPVPATEKLDLFKVSDSNLACEIGDEGLRPAPEGVVLARDTPGSQIALSISETVIATQTTESELLAHAIPDTLAQYLSTPRSNGVDEAFHSVPSGEVRPFTPDTQPETDELSSQAEVTDSTTKDKVRSATQPQEAESSTFLPESTSLLDQDYSTPARTHSSATD